MFDMTGALKSPSLRGCCSVAVHDVGGSLRLTPTYAFGALFLRSRISAQEGCASLSHSSVLGFSSEVLISVHHSNESDLRVGVSSPRDSCSKISSSAPRQARPECGRSAPPSPHRAGRLSAPPRAAAAQPPRLVSGQGGGAEGESWQHRDRATRVQG